MFTITVKLDPETKALLTRVVDLVEGRGQAEVDGMTEKVAGLSKRLQTSRQGLKQAADAVDAADDHTN